jgi:hypothetical protein
LNIKRRGNKKMALSHSPRIITNGLVLCLDAANRKSYPTTGTTWTDLSGRGNNGTLVNGVGYNGSNYGSLSFDGVNDYVSNVSPNLSAAQAEGNITYEYWLEPTQQTYASFTQATGGTAFYDNAPKQGLANHPSYNYNNFSYAGLQFCFGTNGFVAGAFNFNYAPPFLVDYQTYTGISHLVVIKSNNGCSYYVNTILKKTATQSRILGVTPIFITSNNAANWATYFKGNIYSYKLYNRALSASEIKQNYDAFKGRYGLT